MVKLSILKNVNLDIPERELPDLFEKNLDSIEEGLKHVDSYLHIALVSLTFWRLMMKTTR